ncbi:MAG: glycosyltransferase [Methylococcales bacterium]
MMSNCCETNHQLTISIVTFFPDIAEFRQTLMSLKAAINYLSQQMEIVVQVTVVDNSVNQQIADRISQLIQSELMGISQLVTPSVNIGYGQGHNLATRNGTGCWHLVMNADIELDEDALSAALTYLERPANQTVGLISPHCEDGEGQRAYLCKRYPSVLDLALRGFAPIALRQLFQTRLAEYECRDYTEQQSVEPIIIVSGCFMFFRGHAWNAVNGFAEHYFLYFEDFDLCIRLHQAWSIAYVPNVRIVHHGGNAARKGFKHILLFVRSACCFFSTHGWRII